MELPADWWLVDGVRLPAGEAGSRAGPSHEQLAACLGVQVGQVAEVAVVRRSLDARPRPPVYIFRLKVLLEAEPRAALPANVHVERADAPEASPAWAEPVRAPADHRRPVVIGAGPAGLFAALDLAKRGLPPLVLERGEPVETRQRDVARFRREARLDSSSNTVFGEGGAGTFSDGKIYTRSRARHAVLVLHELAQLGAGADLLVDARPHIGTDRLARILPRFRRRLAELGAEIRFGSQVTRFEVRDGRLRALGLACGERIETDAVILATGHHGRDTLRALRDAAVPLESRPTSIGVRIEHEQRAIDRWFYGMSQRGDLPAASYRIALKARGELPRALYSFCMCPGGVVVAAPESPERVVTNGMSGSRRSGRYGNAGLIVPVYLEDYPGEGPLAGVRFLEALERRAYEAGGGGFVAPAQRAADFVAGRAGDRLLHTTYRPGVQAADLASLLPPPVARSLRAGLRLLDRRWRGFAGEGAMLIGVESRTSSPVRVVRGDDGQSVGGLFPAGEGSGYASGILSSASDGIEAARRVARVIEDA